MVTSMTGFGRGKVSEQDFNITVEIKSVNHRYFEYSSRMPRSFQFLDDTLKTQCQQKISRGKVELNVQFEDTSSKSIELAVNEAYADAYISALNKLAKDYKIKNDLKISALAGNNELFKIRKNELSDEVVTSAVSKVALKAIDNFIEMRKVEGERLCADVSSRCETILGKVALVAEKSPETVKAYRERLEQKVRELLEDAKVDEQRLITETAIFADKVAVDEETVRLRSHIKQLTELLVEDQPMGKKLDFIVQEMNRETNTIGSKCQDVGIAHIVVDIKSEIEKIREQIQNIE